MTLLLNCHSLSKAYGARQLFTDIALGIFRGDKIGLIGPNGAGKSTLLKILAGIEAPNSGTVSARKSLRIAYVPQSSEYPAEPIEDIVLKAFLPDHVMPLHERETQVSILLSKLGFKNTTQQANVLSGGWKKRLDIAKQLINAPDVLFLDEPTNHLDLEGIVWLEKFLKGESVAFIVTSHDRYFLQNVATRMMELNPIYPQGIFSAEGSYNDFIDRRADFLAQQLQTERALASKVRDEIDWLRRSPKARTTKSQARVQEAGRLIQELSEVRGRNKQATSKIDFEATDRQTRKLLTVKNVSKSLDGRLLFSGLDFNFAPGMRVGIVGPNGCGKTTLLKIFAGELAPDTGTVKHADGLRIVYFDQHRQLLCPTDTLRQALSPHSDTVVYRGQNIHVNSWAKRFLFSPDRLDLPVKQLSGGERARIGIARLMLQPADLLLLDEPTNDLDIVTLETLEESLREFPGAIALITHDRALLDNVVSCVIGLGFPEEVPILADYHQWEDFVSQQQRKAKQAPLPLKKEETKSPLPAPVSAVSAAPVKLSYKEKSELDGMEAAILKLEQEIARLEKTMQEHTATNDMTALQQVCQQLEIAHKQLDSAFHRWQELEAKVKGLQK